eukprot:scaffold235394_cov31-Tisochrysis_lutea.AAC.2
MACPRPARRAAALREGWRRKEIGLVCTTAVRSLPCRWKRGCSASFTWKHTPSSSNVMRVPFCM